jgi:hypothetical protein
MKSSIFWNITLCSLLKVNCFKRTRDKEYAKQESSIRQQQAQQQQHIPEDRALHNYRHENLISHKELYVFLLQR